MSPGNDKPCVIVGTTVWIDYFNEVETIQTTWLDEHLTDQRG